MSVVGAILMFLTTVMTLLSAVVGSGIALGGSMLVQRMTTSNEKRKDIRAMVEKIYRQALSIPVSNAFLHDPDYYTDPYAVNMDPDPYVEMSKWEGEQRQKEGDRAAIQDTLREMEIVITLYLGPLVKVFAPYKQAVQASLDSPTPQSTETARQEFCSALATFLKEKGYGYLS
jgi:hypothetical protein